MSVKFVDVCCGCGSLSLGLKKSGMKPVFAIDIDKNAVQVYKKNIDSNVEVKDIKNFSLQRGETEVLVSGLPCQGFSTLGKRNLFDDRNYLWIDFLRLIEEGTPTAFLVENVPKFLETFHFKKFLSKLKKNGYFVNYGVLNALDFGVAQNRRRAILMGSVNRMPEIPIKKEWAVKTVRDAIGDLPLIPDGKNDHCSRNVTKLSIERYKCVPPGGDRRNLPKRLQSHCWRKLKKSNSVFGRLEWDKPSVTIRTTFIQPECGRYIHPEAHRPLTIREGARLQGFPDSFKFSGSLRAKTKMIGNAVPSPLAKALGETLISAI